MKYQTNQKCMYVIYVTTFSNMQLCGPFFVASQTASFNNLIDIFNSATLG
jgi:hypothetical protein